MNRLFAVFFALSMLAGCGIFKKSLSTSGEKEKTLVYELLEIMVKNEKSNTKLRSYIAPSYYKNNNINKDKILIDNFTPVGFSIESYNKNNGFVATKIWGNERDWIHSLTFKVVVENNKLYVMPSKHSETYIKPWFKDERYIEE